MDAFIYCADIYCAECAAAIQIDLWGKDKRPTEDSDAWPQGPFADGGGEADTAQHCGACGVALGNAVTGAALAAIADAEVAQDPSLAADGPEQDYEDWLEDTGRDDSFHGDEVSIPGTYDLYEAAIRAAGGVP